MLLNCDTQPTKSYHAKGVGRRADCNTAAYRNILCEFDVGTREEQLAMLEGMPRTTLLWSGSKSLHAIISLETPPKTKEEYKRLVKRIYVKLGKEVDSKCGNPSRLSRAPGGVNEKTGNIQELLEVGSRISSAELDAWLGPDKTLHDAWVAPESGSSEEWRKVLSPWCRTYLQFGSEPGRRNSDAFKFACELWRCGWAEADIYEAIEKVADLPDAELQTCLRSAFASCRSSAYAG